MRTLKKVLGSLRNADNDFDLIQDGDKIAVGISGGKDSSLLLYNLYLYKKFSQKNYEIIGIYADLNFNKNNNIDNLINYFAQYDIKIIKYQTQIYDILKIHQQNDGSLECSLCAKLRRGAIVNAAKEYGCNKLALGHHNDDAVETLFMNMIHGGRIATFQPKAFLEKSQITMIRPLIYAYEKDIENVCQQLAIPIISSECPNDGNTERQDMKDMLNDIYKKYNCHDNFSLMLKNKKQLQLFDVINDDEIK